MINKIRQGWRNLKYWWTDLSGKEQLELTSQLSIVLLTFGFLLIAQLQLSEIREGSKDTKAIAEAAKQQAFNTKTLAEATQHQATDTERLANATKDLATAANQQAKAALDQIKELRASIKVATDQAKAAKEANRIALKALGITQATTKLDLEPKLRIEDYMGKNRPTYLGFFNDGPVPAIHVTVQLFQLGYDQNEKAIRVGLSDSPHSFYVESIRPKNSARMPLDSNILTERYVMSWADAPKTEQPYYNDILEVRVRYYREADGKAFGGRKFFFRTQEGVWARENQSSFPREILAAALKWQSWAFPPFFDLNPLNE